MLGSLKKRVRITRPFDLWNEGGDQKSHGKLHPSKKRDKKIPLPHPGQSYNPDPEDHKKLLAKVLRKELEEQKKAATIDNAIKVRVDAKKLEQDAQEELLAGIKHLVKDETVVDSVNKNHNDDDDDDGSSTDTEAFSEYDEKDFKAIIKDKKVKEKRKTKQQRLRQMKDKLQRKAAKMRKLKNIRSSKFDALKKMIKELDKKEKELASRKIRHKKPKNERLGQKFEKSDPIYCLTSELPSSLRDASCPMDSIVREQLESFQSRLMVEPTRFQVKKRKYKRKVYDRKVAAEQEG